MATAFKGIQGSNYPAVILALDVNGGKVSEYISLKNVKHAQINVICQAMAGSTNMTIRRATSVAGGSAESWTGWDETFVKTNFSASLAEDASETIDFTRTTVTSYTMALATANSHYVVEIDPIQLGIADGWDCLGVAFSNPSASDIITVCVALEMEVEAETPPDPYTD